MKKQPKPRRRPGSRAAFIVPPTRCAFCGKLGRLSREHFFPQWAHPHVIMRKGPRASYSIISQSSYGKGAPLEVKNRRVKNGDVAQLVLHVVCHACNNDWMSQTEQAARELLLRLMEGERFTLNEEQRLVVAKWVILKFLLFDAYSKRDASFVDAQREAFMTASTVPPDVSVWLGFLDAKVPCGSHHQSASITNGDRNAPRPERTNTKTLRFNLGQLYVFVLLDAAHVISLDPDIGKKLVQLWPLRSNDLPWPPVLQLTADESRALGDTIHNLGKKVQIWKHYPDDQP